MLQLILLTLQNLPLRVEHLKQVTSPFSKENSLSGRPHFTSTKCCHFEQNNTAKLVKQLSKSAENEGQLD